MVLYTPHVYIVAMSGYALSIPVLFSFVPQLLNEESLDCMSEGCVIRSWYKGPLDRLIRGFPLCGAGNFYSKLPKCED